MKARILSTASQEANRLAEQIYRSVIEDVVDKAIADEPALISRKITNDFGDGSVEVTEEWDMGHKECPFTRIVNNRGWS